MFSWLRRLFCCPHQWAYVDGTFSEGYDHGPMDYAFPSVTARRRCKLCGAEDVKRYEANPLTISRAKAIADFDTLRPGDPMP